MNQESNRLFLKGEYPQISLATYLAGAPGEINRIRSSLCKFRRHRGTYCLLAFRLSWVADSVQRIKAKYSFLSLSQ